jgi:hypothetical protein
MMDALKLLLNDQNEISLHLLKEHNLFATQPAHEDQREFEAALALMRDLTHPQKFHKCTNPEEFLKKVTQESARLQPASFVFTKPTTEMNAAQFWHASKCRLEKLLEDQHSINVKFNDLRLGGSAMGNDHFLAWGKLVHVGLFALWQGW